MNLSLKHLVSVAAALACGLAAAAADAGFAVDWSRARTVSDGIDVLELAADAPRLMKGYLMRVDLARNGFVGTGRCRANWGEPQPEVQDRFVPCRTERQTTAAFMKEARAEGRDVVAAINTTPWGPWDGRTFNARYAEPFGPTISAGRIVGWQDRASGAYFTVDTNGAARIVRQVPFADHRRYDLVQAAFSVILEKGAGCWNKGDVSLAPRMAVGLSADARTFYALAVDGRQPGWSLGATMADLAVTLQAAGASDALNMDGGGSTTMLYWDPAAQAPVMVNRHDPARKAVRRNAVNLGIVRRK